MFTHSRYKPEVYKAWSSQKLNEALNLADNDLSEALRIYDLLSNTLPDNFLVKVDRTSMANSIEEAIIEINKKDKLAYIFCTGSLYSAGEILKLN